jgi:hypothetical protein
MPAYKSIGTLAIRLLGQDAAHGALPGLSAATMPDGRSGPARKFENSKSINQSEWLIPALRFTPAGRMPAWLRSMRRQAPARSRPPQVAG